MRPLCLNIIFASFKVLHCQKSLSCTDKYVGNSIFTSIVYHLFTLSNCVLIERESILIRTAERKHEHVGKSEGAFSFPIRRRGGVSAVSGSISGLIGITTTVGIPPSGIWTTPD